MVSGPDVSQHDALDALVVRIERTKVNWMLDASIRDVFTSLDHRWLAKFSNTGSRTSGSCG
jgi:hypothetical protein